MVFVLPSGQKLESCKQLPLELINMAYLPFVKGEERAVLKHQKEVSGCIFQR
jgi:hypothetical protein